MNIQEFEKQLKLNYSSKKTIVSYTKQMSKFLNFCDGVVTQETIDSYILDRREKVGVSSLNLFINSLKKYMEYNNLNFELPKQKRVKTKEKPYLTKKELDDILQYTNQIFNDYIIVDFMLQFLFWTGLRPQELLNLKTKDIDFGKKMVIIRSGKGDKDRVIPFLNNKFFNKLEKSYIIKNNENLFNYNMNQLNYIFKKIEEEMSLKYHITPYTMRRSFAKNCIKIGIDVYSLMGLMGHTDVTMTLRYARPDEKMIMEICEKVRGES